MCGKGTATHKGCYNSSVNKSNFDAQPNLRDWSAVCICVNSISEGLTWKMILNKL